MTDFRKDSRQKSGFFGQRWPLNENLSQQTISEEFMLDLSGTIDISCALWHTALVKILRRDDNSQVTNALSTQVGTSEAIRLLSIRQIHNLKDNDLRFKQWLAGLIDGDGCFLLSKKGYASLEVTMDIRDEWALQSIKKVYGGSVKIRSGVSGLRYRLHNKEGILRLIKDVNGEIRNPVRQIQLNYICVKYGLVIKYPQKLTWNNGWLSGFIDAEGTVTIKSTDWQLGISASQKTSEVLTPLVELYGGEIYIDRGGNGSFKWYLTKKEDVKKLIEYLKNNPLRSQKKNRIHLVPKIYELKEKGAHKGGRETLLWRSWEIIMKKWNNYE